MMKMLLTAVAAIALAGAAHAQQTPAPSTPSTDVAPTSSAAPASRDAAAEAAGGYQPSSPALSSTPAPGQDVVANPSPSVDQAYPAPAAKAHYPWCSRTIKDECRQRGG
jgi:hypothetical protein